MSESRIKWPKKWLPWTVFIGVILVAAWAVQSQIGQLNIPTPLSSLVQQPEVSARPSDPHQPVHIRLGIIKEIGVDYFIMEARKLVGLGNERITVLLTDEVKIIEIQIPSYMNEELRKKLAEGKEVIERIMVSREKLYVEQTVEVVSNDDMYGLNDIEATRIEYKIVVDTENNI